MKALSRGPWIALAATLTCIALPTGRAYANHSGVEISETVGAVPSPGRID